MKILNGVLVALVLAGCAQQPAQMDYTGQPQGEAQNRARIHTELAAVYYSRGQLGVALEEVKEALGADPNWGPAYNVLGLVYVELKEDSLAEQNFQRALRINPLDSDAHHNFGGFLCQRKRAEEGIQHLMAALRNPLYQSPDKSYASAGVCSLSRGDVKGAEDYFQKALRLRPTQPNALLGLAELSYRAGHAQSAKDFLARYMQVAQPDAEGLWLGVRVERKLGDRDAEASYSTQLRKRFPESREARALAEGKFD
ncbi:MAG: type IV pilus biogenesis/stability protein PilW [Betaproteobacteria bacterium]|nr:type IV pilus biogenesis/stability protein PilW [Betaproteobacteria bacterium]